MEDDKKPDNDNKPLWVWIALLGRCVCVCVCECETHGQDPVEELLCFPLLKSSCSASS